MLKRLNFYFYIKAFVSPLSSGPISVELAEVTISVGAFTRDFQSRSFSTVIMYCTSNQGGMRDWRQLSGRIVSLRKFAVETPGRGGDYAQISQLDPPQGIYSGYPYGDFQNAPSQLQAVLQSPLSYPAHHLPQELINPKSFAYLLQKIANLRAQHASNNPFEGSPQSSFSGDQSAQAERRPHSSGYGSQPIALPAKRRSVHNVSSNPIESLPACSYNEAKSAQAERRPHSRGYGSPPIALPKERPLLAQPDKGIVRGVPDQYHAKIQERPGLKQEDAGIAKENLSWFVETINITHESEMATEFMQCSYPQHDVQSVAESVPPSHLDLLDLEWYNRETASDYSSSQTRTESESELAQSQHAYGEVEESDNEVPVKYWPRNGLLWNGLPEFFDPPSRLPRRPSDFSSTPSGQVPGGRIACGKPGCPKGRHRVRSITRCLGGLKGGARDKTGPSPSAEVAPPYSQSAADILNQLILASNENRGRAKTKRVAQPLNYEEKYAKELTEGFRRTVPKNPYGYGSAEWRSPVMYWEDDDPSQSS